MTSPIPFLRSSPLAGQDYAPAIRFSSELAENLLRVQTAQLKALSTWHQWAAEINQDLWDRWVCRFGGGVPIDA